MQGFVCDVTSTPSVQGLLASVKAAFPGSPIRFLGVNAGVLFSGSTVLGGSDSEWSTTFEVNVLGVARTLREFLPTLIEQRTAALVEVTCSAASVSFGGSGPYGASKLAALGVVEALYAELLLAQGSPLDYLKFVTLCPAS